MKKRDIDARVAGGSLPPLAADLALVREAATATTDEILGSEEHSVVSKRKRLEKLEAETVAREAEAKNRYRATVRRPLDAREGEIRAALATETSAPNATARALRAQQFAQQALNALAANEITSAWDNVLATSDTEAIRAVASAGRKRHDDLVAGAKFPAQREALQARAAAFGDKVQRWAAANPTPATELNLIERRRAALEIEIEETARFVGRLYGAERTATERMIQQAPRLTQRRSRHGVLAVNRG